MMTLKMKAGLATPVMRAIMNREYLEAKFDLCINEAEKDLQQEEIARAIANLRRANSALSQLFGFEEESDE
jgi:hypothetical protein